MGGGAVAKTNYVVRSDQINSKYKIGYKEERDNSIESF